MTIALASYRSFNYTHSVLDSGRKTWNTSVSGILELIKKVARVALACLALPFAFLLDLVLWPVAALYQRCWAKTTSTPPKSPTGPLSREERILSNPYPGSAAIPSDANQFFQDALRLGLALNHATDKARINELIEGMSNGRQADIWAAGCLLTHYLVTRSHSSTKLFPSIFLHSTSPTSKINLAYKAFLELSSADRSAMLLNAICPIDVPSDVHPNKIGGKFFALAEEVVQDMAQNAAFLALYDGAAKNIQAIAADVVKGSKPV